MGQSYHQKLMGEHANKPELCYCEHTELPPVVLGRVDMVSFHNPTFWSHGSGKFSPVSERLRLFGSKPKVSHLSGVALGLMIQ